MLHAILNFLTHILPKKCAFIIITKLSDLTQEAICVYKMYEKCLVITVAPFVYR